MQLSVGLIFCYFAVAIAYETTLHFDYLSCNFNDKEYNIYDDDDTYNLRWNGGSLSDTCKITFDPVDTEKKICVKAYSYDVNNCDVKLKYFGGLIADDLERTYSCYDSMPDEFCGGDFDNVAVQMSSVSTSSSSSFSLKIYRKRTPNVGLIVGFSVGGVTVSIVIVTICVVVVCRRRRLTTGTVYRNTTGYQQTIVTSNNASNMNFGGNVNQNMNSYPPPPYPGTNTPGTTYSSTSHPTGYTGTTYPASQLAGYSDPTSQRY